MSNFRSISLGTIAVSFLLTLAACGGGGSGGSAPPAGVTSKIDFSDLFVYKSASPYGQSLVGCASAVAAGSSCPFSTLPLLGMENEEVTIGMVMDRVVVSHPWMGERFREILERLPADILMLLKGVTAIVIDDDIRPSFYTTRTGAIYLDPAHLWLTNEEKATVALDEDYRSDFGSDLRFVPLWRYVKDDRYAYLYYSLEDNETRTLDDILYRVAALLYHELGHANDYLPPDRVGTLHPGDTVPAAIARLQGESIADRLYGESPLNSVVWKRLAAVLFGGEKATAEECLYSPEFVGGELAGDGANDDYAYASAREDVAMLFEETMMKYRFGVDRDIAYTIVPANQTPVCDDYLVKWGNRNRIAHPVVSARAIRVAADLLPGEDLSAFFAGLSSPIPMRLDEGWCSNLQLTSVQPLRVRPSADSALDRQLLQDRLPPHRR